ncbi:hypothetical protein H0H92_005390 [Tricholoma furcatifolium]|nr:hypothetical protein H0H92_005390 [Tricholoma furcatifolium]
MLLRTLSFAAIAASSVLATPLMPRPTVRLNNATITGKDSGDVSKFLGIPVGDLRFRLPQPILEYPGSFSAKDFSLSCPQQSVQDNFPSNIPKAVVDQVQNTILGAVFPDSEDCLTINVVKPKAATPSSGYPVVVWIFGGGFEIGGTTIYDGGVIVGRSISMGSPVIFVSMNYRVSGFGFLGGKEVKKAGVGNLGLQDQREALRWIQKYIHAFGGDPKKVTIWGESAGAISVGLHMVANNGDNEGLFRAAFMQSGSPIPVGDIENGQVYYENIVARSGCSAAEDTLECLRTVPYPTLKEAINTSPGFFSYQSLKLAFLPRPDGVFLTDNPQQLVLAGKVANVPFITGDCDDEGTIFALSSLNITYARIVINSRCLTEHPSTNEEFKAYLKNVFLAPGVPDELIDGILRQYPQDPTQGSPFGTLYLNMITRQNKRIAAFMGDGVFQAPRRFLLDHLSEKQNSWAFLSKRLKATPFIGSAHASDLINVFGPLSTGGMADYLIRFAVDLNPNPPSSNKWPKYSTSTRKLLTFQDGLINREVITRDDYRSAAMEFLTNVTLEYPI